MWTLLKKFSTYLGFSEEEKLSEVEEDEIIREVYSSECTEFLSENYLSYEILNGIITHTCENMAVIDGKYFFHLKEAISSNLSTGDHVEFFFDDKLSIVKNVKKKDTVFKAVISDEFNHESENSGCYTTTGIIKQRNARIVIVTTDKSPFEEVTFNLDYISSEFVPLQGDLVILDGLIFNEEFCVKKITPKTTSVKSGIITKWESGFGTINDFAFFTIEYCEPGYIPFEGDKVLASLIRVNHPKGYMWRAIQVVQVSKNIEKFPSDHFELRQDFTDNKNGIVIPVLPKFQLKINQSLDFAVEVQNNNSYSVQLLSIYHNFLTQTHQISLVSPINKGIDIPPSKKLVCNFRINAQYIGHSVIQYTWEFPGFQIPRMFMLEVTSTEVSEMEANDSKELYPNPKLKITGLEVLKQTYGDRMPGQKRRFRSKILPVQLRDYSLPEKILLAALPSNNMSSDDVLIEIEKVIPSLREELSPKNYVSYFTGLLFLEETELLRQVGEMFMERAHFRKIGDYLVLDLPVYSVHTNKLMPGDKVIASLPWKDLSTNNDFKFEGIIHRISPSEIWIQFHQEFHNSYRQGTEYSLSFIVSRHSFRRMHQAVHLSRKFMGDLWLFPTGVPISPPRIVFNKDIRNEVGINENNPCSKFKWNKQGSGYGRNCSIENVVHTNFTPKNIAEINWINHKLNLEQKDAVTNILKAEARPLPYIIFGPPGTGKSMTIVEAILQIHNFFSNSRILVAAPSNSAADILAERILELGNVEQKKFLRLVGLSAFEQGKIAASLLPYSAVIDVKNEYDEKYGVQIITREAMKQFSIIVGTIGCLSTLFNLGFPRGFFTHIFVDEAGQVTEPEILTILILLNMNNGQVILAGDPLQLGPVACSKVAVKFGLQESLLSRFLDRFPYKRDILGFPESYGYDPRLVTKLVNNYRSLPAILRLPNKLFYNDDLVPNVMENSSEEGILLNTLRNSFLIKTIDGNVPPLFFHGVQGTNHQVENSHSWYNPQEVYQVFVYLNLLYKCNISPDHIGIITPYHLQVLKIRQMLEKLNIEPPKIGSVEEFQGQEKMIIILSVVKSNFESVSYDTQRALGFVRNPRRLNVAITRARALLVIIGDPHLLQFDQHWKQIIKHCIFNNVYTGCDPPSSLA